jgi:hypothetical protein
VKQQAYNLAVEDRDSYRYGSAAWRQASTTADAAYSQLSQKRSALTSVQARLDAELKAPPPVVQPLPEAQNAALRWLFWLHLEEVAPRLSCLSRAAFAAQQLLLWPCSRDAKQALAVRSCAWLMLLVGRQLGACSLGGCCTGNNLWVAISSCGLPRLCSLPRSKPTRLRFCRLAGPCAGVVRTALNLGS